jgi:hypothetical protein
MLTWAWMETAELEKEDRCKDYLEEDSLCLYFYLDVEV